LAGFRDSLRDAVRQFAFRTSVDSLRRSGVQNVSVLGLDRIVALVEEAVHTSLRAHLRGSEREAVADATKAEFLRLLRSNEDLQRQKTEAEKQKERAEEEIDQLRRELLSQQQALQQRLQQANLAAAGEYQGEDASIAARVRELFAPLVATGDTNAIPPEAKVIEVVMEIVGGQRRSLEEARQALRDREVENLQRRIHKLNHTLNETEDRLRTVVARQDIEGGISSIYREVQGIDDSVPDRNRRRQLMSAIFEANLQLRQRRGH
jgi:predicted  nucleic acid-binding Zn-ribbon protein